MTLIKLELWGWHLTFTGSLHCVENLPLSATLGWEDFLRTREEQTGALQPCKLFHGAREMLSDPC